MKGRQEDGQGRHSAAHAAQTTQNGHVDPDVLAEFRAGLITDHGLFTGRRGRAIAAHLTSCVACAALDVRLAQVSAVLAAAPVPAVPDAVARRLDGALAALAAESQKPISSERLSELPAPRLLPSGAGAAGGGVSGGGVSGGASGGDASGNGGSRDGTEWARRLLRVRVLAPAAAALAALAAAGYGLSSIAPSSSYSTPTAGSAARAANSAGSQASLPSGAAGAARAAPTAAGSNATFTPNRDQGAKNQTGNGTYSSGDQVFVVSSGLDYQPATLLEQVAAQLKDSKALRAGPASASVTACVLNVADGNPRLLVESAQYNGRPATIIVVPGTAGDVVFVAGPGCTGTVSDILNHAVLSPGTTAP